MGDRQRCSADWPVQPHPMLKKGIAGITRRPRIHDLRHTFGSNLSSQGVPVQMVAKMTGHSSTRMTDQYARPDAEVTRSVVALTLEAVRERRDPREMAANDTREPSPPKRKEPRGNGAPNFFRCLMFNGGAYSAIIELGCSPSRGPCRRQPRRRSSPHPPLGSLRRPAPHTPKLKVLPPAVQGLRRGHGQTGQGVAPSSVSVGSGTAASAPAFPV